jgi:hypothetical protein
VSNCSDGIKLNLFNIIRTLATKMAPKTKAKHQTMLEKESPTPYK